MVECQTASSNISLSWHITNYISRGEISACVEDPKWLITRAEAVGLLVCNPDAIIPGTFPLVFCNQYDLYSTR